MVSGEIPNRRGNRGQAEDRFRRQWRGERDPDAVGRARRLHTARVDGHVRISLHTAGWHRAVLRWPHSVPVLEPRPGRVHDRPPHTVDARSRMGEVEVQETGGPQRPQQRSRRTLHPQRRSLQRGRAADSSGAGHHHRGSHRLHFPDGARIPGGVAGDGSDPRGGLGAVAVKADRRQDGLHLSGQ